MSKAIRLVVVDDHTLFRRGLVSLLSEMDNMVVVAEASNGEEALGTILELKPDVILLDINMPGISGVRVLTEIREQGIDIPVLMLTISQQEEDLIGAIRAGANGYLLKSAEPETLQKTIKQVVAGDSVLAPEIVKQVFGMMRSGQLGMAKLLTDREIQVLRLLMRGASTSQVAENISISENTVKTHIRNILKKLEVGSRTEAVAKATKLNLI